MRVAVIGALGSGKTLFMTAIGILMSKLFEVPIAANYMLKNVQFKRIKSLDDLWSFENGVMLLDEFWINFDSRAPGANVVVSRWVNQTRKRHLVVFYTSQSIDQIDKRLRRVTDYVAYCQKKKLGVEVSLIEMASMRLVAVLRLRRPDLWYGEYNTDEVVDLFSGSSARPMARVAQTAA